MSWKTAVACLLFLISPGLLLRATAQAGDYALSFNGRDDFIKIAHHEDLNPEKENWTCEFWVKLIEDFEIAHNKFLAKRDGPGDTGGFYIGSQFAPACSEGNRQNLDYRRSIPVGEWTHLAVQIDRDENMLRVYINGELASDQRSQLTGSVDAGSDLVIGGDSTGALQGNRCKIRNLRIWKGVNLTESQIHAKMLEEFSGNEDNLVGYWPMDEGEGGRVHDASGNGNHGRFGPVWGGTDLRETVERKKEAARRREESVVEIELPR